jgi:peptide chain release factor
MQDNRQKITIVSKKDLEFSYYIGPGHGGQNKQKTSSGCQISHPESGAMSKCSEHRSQAQNKKIAFEKLLETPKFKFWLAKKLYEIREGEKIEQQVENSINNPKNLKTEIKRDGRWEEVNNDYFNTEEAKRCHDI